MEGRVVEVKRGCSISKLVAILKRVDGSFSKLRDLYDVLACVLGVPLAEGRVEAEECWELLKEGEIGGELPLYLLLQQWLGKRRSDGQPPRLTALLKALDAIGMKEEADAIRDVFYTGQKKKNDEVAGPSLDDVDVAKDSEDDFKCLRDNFEALKRRFLQSEQDSKRLEEENSVLRGQLKMKYEALVKTESAGTDNESHAPPPPVKEEVDEPPADPLEVVNLDLSNILPAAESPEEDGGNFGEFSPDTAVENEREIDLKVMDDPSHPHYPFEFVVDVEENEDQSVGGSFPDTDEGSEMDMNVEVRPTTTPTNNPSTTMGPHLQLVVSSPAKPGLKTSQLSVNLEVQEIANGVFANEKKAENQQKALAELREECPDSFISANVDDVGLENVNGCEGVAGSSDDHAVTETVQRTLYNTRRRCSTRFNPTAAVRRPSKQRRPTQLRGRNTRQLSLVMAALATTRSNRQESTRSRRAGLRSASEKRKNSSQNEAPEATSFFTATNKSSTASGVEGETEPDPPQKKRKRHPMVIPDHITILEVSGEQPIYQCGICHRKFKTRQTIKYHKFCGAESKPFKCQTCGKGFVFKYQYENHRRIHTGEKPHVCPMCQKGFRRRGHLIVHMRFHTGDKAFVCQECKRGFATAETLRNHTMIHTGEHPFACTHCDRRFSQKKGLNDHLITHTGERRFSCNLCGRSFGLKRNLDSHVLVVHSKERPYPCGQCSKAFRSSNNLRQHLRIHSGVKPFQCGICRCSFGRKSTLNSHIKTQHNRLKKGVSVNEKVA